MFNLLREAGFVDVPLEDPREKVCLIRDGVEVLKLDHPTYPYQVGTSSGATLAEAVLEELRRFHKGFLDDLDGLPEHPPDSLTDQVVCAHARRFAALMSVWRLGE